jgi:hypothetical protein
VCGEVGANVRRLCRGVGGQVCFEGTELMRQVNKSTGNGHSLMPGSTNPAAADGSSWAGPAPRPAHETWCKQSSDGC